MQQDRRSKNKYNHRISRKSYVNLIEEMVRTNLLSLSNFIKGCSNLIMELECRKGRFKSTGVGSSHHVEEGSS